MSLTVEVRQEYESLRPWIAALPQQCADRQGRSLYQGRNQILLFERDGRQWVVKCFKRHGAVKRVIYTFFRKNKARRSYENAIQLLARGYQTPAPVAFMEERRWLTIERVYYVCAYTDAQPIRPALIEQETFDESLATAYARYVASLHEAGVLHRDLNPTNVLFTKCGGDYRFELIDINRMRFYNGAVPKRECMENLTLFWWLSPVYRFVLDAYAACRHWGEEDVAEAVRVKQRHDRAWIWRKRITHPFRHSSHRNAT